MPIEHLTSDYIDDIALQLDEDVYCANGDLSDEQIFDRLIEAIHRNTDYRFVDSGMIPVRQVAYLLKHMWEYQDRKFMNVEGRVTKLIEQLRKDGLA
jgi:hypothetical protein